MRDARAVATHTARCAVTATSVTRGNKSMDSSKFSNSTRITVNSLGDDVRQETIVEAEVGQFKKLELVLRSGGRFSLNATNLKKMQKAYGKETDDWMGKEVKLVVGEVTFKGEQVESVVLTPVTPPTANRKSRSQARSDIHRPLN